MEWTKCSMIFIISLCFAKSPNKIIDGRRANIRDYPYVVSVQFLNSHLCGASIVKPDYVLTSSSCLLFDLTVIAGNLLVIAGTSDLFNTSNYTSVHEVSYVIYHPHYEPNSFWRNDIALLKLTKPFVYSINCWNIDMAISYSGGRKIFELAGWGNTDRNNQIYTPSRNLHAIQLYSKKIEDCQEFYGDFIVLSESFIHGSIGCAASGSEYQDIAPGDGGSGLIGTDKVHGVVSIYRKKGNSFIYTKIFKYRFWIDAMIEKN